MGIWGWLTKAFNKEEPVIPSYRFGGFTYNELWLIWQSLELMIKQQIHLSVSFSDKAEFEERNKRLSQLYLEVCKAMDQCAKNDMNFWLGR